MQDSLQYLSEVSKISSSLKMDVEECYVNKWKIENNDKIDDSDACEFRMDEECTSTKKKCDYFLCPRLSRGMLDKYDIETISSYFLPKEKIGIAGLLIASTLYSIQSESYEFKTMAQVWLLAVTGLWIMSNIKGTFVNLKMKFNYAIVMSISITLLILRETLIKAIPFIINPTVLVINDIPTILLGTPALIWFSFCLVFCLAIYSILKENKGEMKQ